MICVTKNTTDQRFVSDLKGGGWGRGGNEEQKQNKQTNTQQISELCVI